ncbi:MAG: DUF4350 domain-containing protein [Candidatus Riflebacteria bacterium]|nr:DUF4350 domain-containing protein [Candidatus Riflebacteria bacterium]
MDRLKGYFILILSLFVFSMWGINLISLAQIETEIPGIPSSERTETHTTEVAPKPFLYFFLKNAGFEVRLISGVPTVNQPLLIVDPPVKLDATFNQALLRWVRAGGTLVIVNSSSSTPLQLASSLGAEPASQDSVERPIATGLFPNMKDVGTLNITSGYNTPSTNPFHLFFKRDDGASPVMETWRGSGNVILINGSDFSSPNGLKQADNVIWLVRLLESISPGHQLTMLDPRIIINVVSRTTTGVAATPSRKISKTFVSLWSLISSNPISWVLAQLAFALLAYFYALGRRFGRPIPLSSATTSHDSFITGMGRLLHRRCSSAFAAQHIQQSIISSMRPRLGLPPNADMTAVVSRFGVLYPQHLKQFRASLLGLTELSTKGVATAATQEDEAALLKHVRGLETIRKELKIHD